MYSLTKSDMKLLRYVYRHKSGVSRIKLQNRFKHDRNTIDLLCNLGYIQHNYEFPRDNSGFPIGSVPDSAIYRIENSGITEVENHQWFNLQYVLSQILVPIVIALLTCTLTLLFSQ